VLVVVVLNWSMDWWELEALQLVRGLKVTFDECHPQEWLRGAD